MVGGLHIERNDGRHPSLTNNEVGRPAELLDSLQHTTGKEDGTLTIVGVFIAAFVHGHLALGEIVFVVNEVYLYS